MGSIPAGSIEKPLVLAKLPPTVSFFVYLIFDVFDILSLCQHNPYNNNFSPFLHKMLMTFSVFTFTSFNYSLGLNSDLVHVPALSDRGEAVAFYALFRLDNGGYGFEVMSRADIDSFALKYSKSSAYSPWNTNFEEMAKKTVIKKVLKYTPLKSDFQRALSNDCTIKTEFAPDIEVEPEDIINMEEGEVIETT